jgi:hypothetical protein
MTDKEKLREALKVAKSEIEWWVQEHSCCAGQEQKAMYIINRVLAETSEPKQ